MSEPDAAVKEQAQREDCDRLAFLHTRRLARRHRDLATLNAVVGWAHDPAPSGEAQAVADFRAGVLRTATEAPP